MADSHMLMSSLVTERFFEDLINNSCHTLLSGFLHYASKRMLTLIDVNVQARLIFTTLDTKLKTFQVFNECENLLSMY